jgi:poly(3-hydroxyalkanoate) synthetase
LVKFPSPIGASEEEAEWIADQPGISFDAALLAGTLGVVKRSLVWRETARAGSRLATRPHRLARPLARLAADTAKIATRRSQIDPARRDRRYADRAWNSNPLFKGLAQEHAALALAIDQLLDAAELAPADDYRLRLVAINLIEALAPANWPWSNPAAWKANFDTAVVSLVTGAKRLKDDTSKPPHLPVRSAPGQFTLGEDVAATPGSIVLRTPVMELIQFDATTDEVKQEPLLMVPSLVNKYYLTDLAPGRSLVEYAVDRGCQVFHISWVNPDVEHRHFDLDTDVAAIVEALDAVRAITGSEQVHALGVCAGGQLLTIALAHLAALGRQDEIASFTLTVSVLDHSEPASPTGLMDRSAADQALERVRKDGLVDGRRLQAALAWLRPIDSIWWAWVQRYLLIADLPRMDLFYWSEDTTNLPAGLVCDLIELTLENKLTKPDALTVLGTPIDLHRVKNPAYLIAGLTDNLTPWRSCYATAHMIGSRANFVLVTGGHLQAILRPPGGRSAGYRTASFTPDSPDEWLRRSKPHDNSWWDHWLAWVERRTSGRRPAPAAAGNEEYPVLDAAPGSYVARRL